MSLLTLLRLSGNKEQIIQITLETRDRRGCVAGVFTPALAYT